MKKSTQIVGWVLCVILVIGGLGCGSTLAAVLFLASAVLVCPLFRGRVKLSGKVWIPLAVVLFFTGCAIMPKPAVSEKPPAAPASSEPAPAESEQGNEAPVMVTPSDVSTVPPAEPTGEETGDQEPGTVADSYTVPLGGSNVAIKRHPVLSGSGAAILDIGVGETSAEVMAAVSSDELSAFIGALDFESYGYNNIVLSFEDGTGLVFGKGLSSLTADYGYVDVAPGNFEITERLGAIWNEGEGWYYMTVAEMEAEDSAG